MVGIRNKFKFDGLFTISNENKGGGGVWQCYGKIVLMFG